MEKQPTTLVELLSVSIVSRHLVPYLPVQALVNLAAASQELRSLLSSSDTWRHLNLSTIRHAALDSTPIDVGGITWRAERMDEALTEDDFYAGPLRGIFTKLQRRDVLQHVQTLVLDGLSVPADLVREILCEDRFSVRVLSVRESTHLNMHKLNQILRYITRPTRAEGTPRLRALYVFGPRTSKITIPSTTSKAQPRLGVMSSPGAQIGAQWNERSSQAVESWASSEEAKWYGNIGRALKRPLSDWPETLQVCKGIIHFDAVLCRGPRHDITKVDSQDFLQPTVATIALGRSGCEMCHSCPELPAVYGESDLSAFPLLGPVPIHSSTIRACLKPTSGPGGTAPPLILRCEDCLRDRWCEQCNRWWCEDCYQIPKFRTQSVPPDANPLPQSSSEFQNTSQSSQTTKVFSRLCVENCLVGEMMIGAGSNGMWG